MSHGVPAKLAIAAYTLVALALMSGLLMVVSWILWAWGPYVLLLVLFGVGAVLIVGGLILWDAWGPDGET